MWALSCLEVCGRCGLKTNGGDGKVGDEKTKRGGDEHCWDGKGYGFMLVNGADCAFLRWFVVVAKNDELEVGRRSRQREYTTEDGKSRQ